MLSPNQQYESFERFQTNYSSCSISSSQANVRMSTCLHKNSSGDEIANVNFFYNIAHVEASAYAH